MRCETSLPGGAALLLILKKEYVTAKGKTVSIGVCRRLVQDFVGG